MRSVMKFVAVCAWSVASAAWAQPVTSAFTYQGELRASGLPAAGAYDFRLRLYDAASGGAQVGPTLCVSNLPVDAGRFTLELDFGAVFAGSSRYLEIEVRSFIGLACGSPVGYTTLAPRQRLTATPHAAYTLAAGNASLLNNQPGSFYLNAANLSAGTLPDARLSANVTTLAGAQAFSGTKTFSAAPAFSSAGSPFTVTSTTRVNNLNADLLDGLDSTAFAPASHTHDAAAISSGTLADARIPLTVPRLDSGNTFTAGQTVSGAMQTPLTMIGSNTGGAWLTLQNTGGGRAWNLIATGSGNGEGAGKLLVRDQTGSAVRLAIDPSGRLGLGTTSPSALFELSQPDASVRVRNTNDPGGGFVLNTFSTLQLGLYNPSASAWGVVPAGVQRSMFGVQNTGRVGTLTNTTGSPVWRNTIDDGSGNASFQGTIAATNLPAVKQATRDTGVSLVTNNSITVIEDLTVNVPASGYLLITCQSVLFAYTNTPDDSTVYLELKETTGAEVLLKESPMRLRPPLSGPDMSIESTQLIHHVVPVNAGVRRFKVRIRHSGGGGGGTLRGGDITVMYVPHSL
ncbi:MAG: hypothetical protein HRU70_08180 [Phycisphaeraceae bacterium]|nr:MAG: hypothetical protein HRU70_08180 [Phycisphaeraceae bacterium]